MTSQWAYKLDDSLGRMDSLSTRPRLMCRSRRAKAIGCPAVGYSRQQPDELKEESMVDVWTYRIDVFPIDESIQRPDIAVFKFSQAMVTSRQDR